MRTLLGIGTTLFVLLTAPNAIAQPNWQGVPFYYGYGTTAYGPQGFVNDLKSWDPDGAGSDPAVLVIGGSFQTVIRVDGSSFRANNICKWDGCDYQPLCDTTQAPNDQGFGNTGTPVECLEVYEGVLYAGGKFTTADGGAAKGIASWNGTNWSEVGGGVVDGSSNPGTVWDLHVHNDGSATYLYLGGQFATAGASSSHSLVRWDGSSWSSIGDVNKCASPYDAEGTVKSIASEGEDLVIGGDFWEVGGVIAADTAWYSGSTWTRTSSVLGIGENVPVPPCTPFCGNTSRSTVQAVGSDLTNSWAGGDVGGGSGGVGKLAYDACNVPSPQVYLTGIAHSQRTTWADAGDGPTMMTSSQFLLVGSDFYAVGDSQPYPPNTTPTSYPQNVCTWSGSAWTPVGDYLNYAVRAIEVFNGEIYIAGDFDGATTTPGGTVRPLGGAVARLTNQCSAGDVGRTGGVEGGDGVFDNNDWVVYNTLFANGCPAADVGTTGGVPGRDGVFSNDDYVVFISLFYSGCP